MVDIGDIEYELEEANGDYEAVIDLFYNDESNYNNADKTTGMIAQDRDSIKAEVMSVYRAMKEDEDRCSHCLHELDDEDYITEQNMCTDDPYPIYETIVTGYICNNCGEEENF
jgi:hypothetical protein